MNEETAKRIVDALIEDLVMWSPLPSAQAREDVRETWTAIVMSGGEQIDG